MQTTRLIKEARSLLLPWCVICIAGVLHLFLPPSWSKTGWIREGLTPFGFFFGLPFLAALSFGNEFQNRTFQLLLSQPADRMQIWREKMTVTVVAILSAAMVYFFGWSTGSFQFDQFFEALTVLVVIASITSVTYWTLVARSTIGGFALYGIGCSLVFQIPYVIFQVCNFNYLHFSPAETMRVIYVGGAIITSVYAPLMLWLGRRKLVQFQLTGGTAGDDLLMAGPNVVPEYLVRWFRCRPTGATLNLVRKELRLLRPLWMIMILVIPVWVCVTIIIQFLPEHASTGKLSTDLRATLLGLAFVTAIPIISFLAGAMSMGEERTSGTHSWHMTLPVSSGLQWIIKLGVGLSTALVCAGLIPLLVLNIGGLQPPQHDEMVWLIDVLLFCLVGFWCACVANGTVRAIVWVAPVILAIGLVAQFGDWVAHEVSSVFGTLFEVISSRFDAGLKFTKSVSNIDLYGSPLLPPLFITLVIVPLALFMVAQSYRLFRAQVQENRLSILRPLLPVVTFAFLCTFTVMSFLAFVDQAKQQMWTMFRETHEAIVVAQPIMEKQDTVQPLQLTGEDLYKATPLSEQTRRWLHNASITVVPETPKHSGPYCCGGNSRGYRGLSLGKTHSWYSAMIHLENGSQCVLSFQANQSPRGTYYFGILGGKCE